jgi:small subunit ribosomal protein S1
MEANLTETTTDALELKRKAHFSGTVVKTSLAGVVVDIGIGVPGVVHISQLQKDPVNRVEDVVQVGQTVDVWVRRNTDKGDRVDLTMIKPLEFDWRDLKAEMVLKGKVVRLETFGAFVDIGAERPGLVHVSELTHGFIKSPSEVVKEGDEVEVKVLDIDRKKKQIRLSMKALEEAPAPVVRAEKPSRERGKDKESVSEEAPEAPIPTAMEMALREAMERSQSKQPVDASAPKGKKKSSNRKEQNLEDILARTLHHRRS